MADPFNTQPQRNYLDDILDQAFNDLEVERQRQENIINAPDPAQRLGEIQKIEKQTENETPEVQEAVRQNAYTNTSYYTGRPLNKQKPTKPGSTRQPMSEAMYNRLAQGSAELGQGLASAPGLIYGLASFPQRQLAKIPGLESLDNGTREVEEYLSLNPIAKYYKDTADKFREQNTRYDESIVDYIKQGNLVDALGLTAVEIVGSIPYTASMIAGGYAGVPAKLTVPAVGAVAGGQKNSTLLEEMPELADDRRTLNALVDGLAEGTFEQLGSAGIGRTIKSLSGDLIKQFGRKNGNKILTESIAKVFKDKSSRFMVPKAMNQEGWEEFATTVMQNWNAQKTGEDPGRDLFEGAIDSYIVGAGAGGAITAPVGIAVRKQRKEAKKLEKAKKKGLEAIKSGQLRQLTDQDVSDFGRSLTKEEAMEIGVAQETGEIDPGSELGKEMIRRNLEMDKFPETKTEFREAGARANIKQQQMEGKDFVGKLIEKAQSESGIAIEREYMDRTLADEIEQEGWTEEETKKALQDHGINEKTDPNKIIITGTSFGGSIRISTAGTEKRMADEYVAVQEEMAEEYYKAEQENNPEFENEISEDRRKYNEATGEQDTGESNLEWFSTKAVHFATQGKVHQSIGAKLTEIFNRFIDNARTILKDAFKLRKAIKEGKVSDSLIKKLEEATDFKKVGEKVKQAKESKKDPTYRISELIDKKYDVPYGPVTVGIYENDKNNTLTIDELVIDKSERDTGLGTQVMNDIIQYADSNGLKILLTPSTEFGGTSISRLKKFYKRFGFVENKGRNKDFSTRESMYRNPVSSSYRMSIAEGMEKLRTKPALRAPAKDEKLSKGQIKNRIKRLKRDVLPEIENFAKTNPREFDEAIDWYFNDIRVAIDVLSNENKFVKDHPTLFTAIIAITSNGQKVPGQYNDTADVINHFTKNKSFPIVDSFTTGKIKKPIKVLKLDNEKQLGGARPGVIGQSMNRLQYIIDQLGLEGAEAWLLTPKTGIEIHEMAWNSGTYKQGNGMPGISKDRKNTAEDYRGMHIFGRKIGNFGLAFWDLNREAVIDVWMSRWYNRHMGTPFNSNGDLQESPRNTSEWNLISQGVSELTDEMNKRYNKNYTVSQIQAVIWYHEKYYYEKNGINFNKGINYSRSANERAKQKGYTKDSEKLVPVSDVTGKEQEGSQEDTRRVSEEKPTYRLAPTFYSTAERVVIEKFPLTMKSQSVENFLKKNQVKPEEIQWLDLETLLKGKQKITKEELQDWIQVNKIDVQDVMLGESSTIDEERSLTKNEFIKMFEVFDPAYPDAEPMNTLDDGETAEFIADDIYTDFKYYKAGDNEYVSLVDEIDGLSLFTVEPRELGSGYNFGNIVQRNITNVAPGIDGLKNIIENLSTSATKHSSFQLPGEKEDYRELLLTLPKRPLTSEELKYNKVEKFSTGHYDEPNILAHVRFNTRKSPAGEQVLFIEELQSDWHTKGREKGYKGKTYVRKYNDDEAFKIYSNVAKELREILEKDKVSDIVKGMIRRRLQNVKNSNDMHIDYILTQLRVSIGMFENQKISSKSRDRISVLSNQLEKLEKDVGNELVESRKSQMVPDAPFKGNGWIELIMKRMLRYASENNFDRIAWTTSNQQIERWRSELRQNVDQISWQKNIPRIQSFEEFYKSYGLGREIARANYDQYVEEESEAIQRMGSPVIVNGLKKNENVFNQTIPLEGETTINGQKVTLEGLLGKQMATQIRNSEDRTGVIQGDNLTVGGQGFKTVYDFAIKKILNKMGKKFGAKVDQVEILETSKPTWSDGKELTPEEIIQLSMPGVYSEDVKQTYSVITQPSIPVTRKMKESALKGQPTFRASKMTSTDDVLSSPSFKKWFKGSQVKDKDGNPLVVYHGTVGDFNKFDKKKSYGDGIFGFYFTPDPSIASSYSIGWEDLPSDKPNVLPVYLQMNKPYNITYEKDLVGPTPEKIRKWKSEGYDGIIDKENNIYQVFEPTQIKSIFNKGTFNPHDPRISFRMAPTNLVTPLAKIYQEQKGNKKSYTKKDFEIDLVRLGYPDETLKTAMDLFGIIRIKQIATDEPTPIEKELQKIQDLAVTRSNLKERIKRAYRIGAVEKEKEIAKLQKIVTNYARKNLPVGIYSKSEVTGLLAKVRDAKRARELATALERIDRIIDKVNKRSALSKWNKTVKKKANVKKVKGITEGTVGADVQEIVYTIRGKKKGTGYMDLTLAGVEQKIELLADIMEASEDGEPTDQQSLKLNLLLTYGAIKEKSAEDIARATEQFDALVTAGRVQVIEDQEAYKARMKEIGDEILDVITGGAGVQTQASAQKLGLKKQGYIKRIKKGLSKFDSQNQSLEYIFDKLSRLDKTSKPLESAINNYFMPMIRQARLSEYSGLVEMNTMLKENAERIFKVKNGKLTTRLNQNTIDTIIIQHNDGVKNDVKGPLIESELTYNQAYKKWMELMDPTLHPTFEKMGWDVNKTKRQIEDQLPKDMIKWAEWQLYEFYPMYYHRVNGTFRKRFRVNMAFNPMYSPISRRIGARADEGDDTLNKSKSPMGSMTSAGSLKSRVSNQEELTWLDGDTSIMKHITEMEHFIHYTDVMREMRSVFMNRNISKSIADFHGSGISQVLNKFMDDIARGGVDRAQNLEWMDKLRANFSRSVIGINPVVYAKQLASIPAYIADIPALDWATEFAKVFNPLEFKRMYRTLSKSKMVEMRYDQGFERDMVTALQNQKPGKLISGTDFVNTFAYAFTKMGDKQAIFLGGWAVYKYHYKKAIKDGKSIENAKQIAMKKFEEASLRSQQASNVEDLADFQRRGSLAKLFTMFMTSPNQYYRMVIGGYRNFFAGRGDKSENLRRIFVGQFLLPTLFQFISNGFKWDDKDQAVSILLFPFSGLLFFGKGVEHIIKSIYNLAYPMGPVSILDPFTDFGKSVQKTFNGKEFNAKKLFFIIDTFVSGFSKVFGVPYSGPKRAIENTIEVLTEKTDLSLKDKTLKGLGFPMEKKKKKKKKRKKKPKTNNPIYIN